MFPASPIFYVDGFLYFYFWKRYRDFFRCITDSERESCAAPNVKVGDKAPMSDGVFAIVKSLSYSSIRCKDSKSLIRAKIVSLASN